jgi:hypothetical protein
MSDTEIEEVAKFIYYALQGNQVIDANVTEVPPLPRIPWAHPMNHQERPRFIQAAKIVIAHIRSLEHV